MPCHIMQSVKFNTYKNISLSQIRICPKLYCVTQPEQKTFMSKIKYICHVLLNLSSYTTNYCSFQNKPVYPFSQFGSFQNLPIKIGMLFYCSFQNKPVYPFSQFRCFQQLPIKIGMLLEND